MLPPSRIIKFLIHSAAVFFIALFGIQQIGLKKEVDALQMNMLQQKKIPVQSDRETKFTHLIDYPSFTEKLELTDKQVHNLLKAYEALARENDEIINMLKLNHPGVYEELIQKKRPTENQNL